MSDDNVCIYHDDDDDDNCKSRSVLKNVAAEVEAAVEGRKEAKTKI